MDSENPLTRHIDSVNESYFEHMGHALSFAGRMFVASLCCFIHGLLPFCFERTGSRCIETLHDRMVVSRDKLSRAYREGRVPGLREG